MGNTIALFVLCASAWLMPAGGPAEDAYTLFLIGQPDGYTAEFGSTAEGYPGFSTVFVAPVEFTVGRDDAKAWPFIHPAPRDTWAGGREHTFTIHYTAERDEGRPLYLVLGLADAHATESSRVVVTVNGVGQPAQTAPAGEQVLAYDTGTPGTARAMLFALPAGTIRAGANEIAIHLEGESWIIYDYVALRTVAEAPPIAAPDLVGRALEGPLHDVDKIVYATRSLAGDGHWYANFGYYADGPQRTSYGAAGALCLLDPRTGQVTTLVGDPEGAVRDPQVHYDGRTILFAWRRGGAANFHLWEIQADGSGLRQITDGPFDDFEPTYLPDDSILFVSSRCKRWVNCWLTQVAVLFRCDRNGGELRQVSANIEHDNTPWPLSDGRVLYQRWEYVDRSQVHYHHLWSANPDGTGQMVYFGNMHPGIVMIDAKPIPGSDEVVAVFSPGHGMREHAGTITVLSPRSGPDAMSATRSIGHAGNSRDPYPLGAGAFLVAQEDRLVLLDEHGRPAVLHRLGEAARSRGAWLHEPRPLVPREREPVIAPRSDPSETTGRLILADLHVGRNMEGVERGEITDLLVMESLPKPINYTGGMDPLSYGGTFTLERIVGTVPVEEDGSAYLELPALRSFFLIARDAEGHAVKRMQSFLTVMPGETTSCLGCHEQRTRAPAVGSSGTLLALGRPPSVPEPVPGVPDVIDFPRDVQPILDRHCVSCHDAVHPDGGVVLSGDRGPMFSLSYYALTIRHEFVDGRNDPISNRAPRSIGAVASPLMGRLAGEHYDVVVPEPERRILRYWIEAGAPYPGTYAALGSGMVGGYHENQQVGTDWGWPAQARAAEVIDRRCASCHHGESVLPRALSDERDVSFWRPDPNDPRLRLSRHAVFNLSRPAMSSLLRGPLATQAGGWGSCGDEVFTSTDDPDYVALLELCTAGSEHLQRIRRFDMDGFRPPAAYVREMKRYGVLSADLPGDALVDPYTTDRAYWRSLWY